jgi:hypothetical protein
VRGGRVRIGLQRHPVDGAAAGRLDHADPGPAERGDHPADCTVPLYAQPTSPDWTALGNSVPTSCSDVPYYQTLYNYVHNLGGIAMLDPGTVTSNCYMPVSDILQVFVDSQAQFQHQTFPSWMAGYPSSRFSAAISAGSAAQVGTDAGEAATGIGNVYVDDENEPPTYQALPAFWSTEASDIASQP